MAAEMSASEENRISRRDFKNGERGRKMIGGTVKSSFLIGQLIVARANEPSETRKPSRRKRSRKGKTHGCALSLYEQINNQSKNLYAGDVGCAGISWVNRHLIVARSSSDQP